MDGSVLDGKCLAANDLAHSTRDEWVRYWIVQARKRLETKKSPATGLG